MWNTSDTSDRAHTPWKLDVSLRLRSTRGHFVLTVAFSLSLSFFLLHIFSFTFVPRNNDGGVEFENIRRCYNNFGNIACAIGWKNFDFGFWLVPIILPRN